MVEVIVAPDVEGLAVAFLRSQFVARSMSDAQVATKFPTSPKRLFVRVSRTGGGMRDIAYDQPTLLFECYGDTEPNTERFAALVRGLVLAWAGLSDAVTRVRDGGGLAFLPDPDTNKPRYQFAAQVAVKASAV